ncbi:MAG: acyl-CoA thioester hydrolase/BAAT C-terminal domain-containing protein [Rikenellaceae bacterium]
MNNPYCNFKCILVVLASLLLCMNVHASNYKIDYFSIKHTKSELIDCVKISNDSQKKPVILFCVGSSPMPIILSDEGSDYILPLGNFDFESLLNSYNIVIFSHPYIPASATIDQLDDNLYYFPNGDKDAEQAYADSDYLENHVKRAKRVISYLRKQPWVERDKIIILGHSQGAHVAAHVAMDNKLIYAVGYFCGNPLGRYAESIAKDQKVLSMEPIIAKKDALQSNINCSYDAWKSVCNPENREANKFWISFSHSYLESMSHIEANLFIAYGTEDNGSSSSVYIPIYLDIAQKTNYHIEAFVGRGHNFELIEDGKSNYDDMKWQEAIDKFVNWLEDIE